MSHSENEHLSWTSLAGVKILVTSSAVIGDSDKTSCLRDAIDCVSMAT